MVDAFDPRDYGAVLDGLTDDLSAFQDMLAHVPGEGGIIAMPPGLAWLSDTLVITKPVYVLGQGGNPTHRSGFMFAPRPRRCIQLDSVFVSSDGNSAVYHQLRNLNVLSRALIHNTYHGTGVGGRGIWQWAVEDMIRVGDCVTKQLEADPNRMFRCLDTGAGREAVELEGSQPSWSTSLGALLTDAQGITWSTEALPALRLSGHAYSVGDRVLLRNDNRYILECVTAGTSAASGSIPLDLHGQPSFADGITGTFAGNLQMGGTIADGTVVWSIDSACGAYVNAGFGILERVYFENLSGPGLLVQGGVGMDVRGTTGADDEAIRDCQAYFTGVGVAMGGSDANEWVLENFFGYGFGTLHPSADPVGSYPYPDGGQGGHGVHDRSDASGTVTELSIQMSSGRPILKTGNGIMTVTGCFEELPDYAQALLVKAGRAVVLGGNLIPDRLSKTGGCGVTFIGAETGPVLLSLDRALVDTGGGFEVTVIGVALLAYNGETVCTLDGDPVDITANTPTSLTFVMPARSAGSHSLVVTTAGGASNALSVVCWDPSQIAGVNAYFDSGKNVTSSGSDVTSWKEQIAAEAYDSVATHHPTLVADVFGGLPSVRMNGSQWVQASSSYRLLASGRSVFWVGRWTSTKSAPVDYAGNPPLTVLGDRIDPTCQTGASAGEITSMQYTAGWTEVDRGSGLNDDVVRLVGLTFDTSNNVKMFLGETQQGSTGTQTYNTSMNKWNVVGAGYKNGTLAGDGFDGDLGAVVVVDGVISSGDLTKLHQWAQGRFGAV